MTPAFISSPAAPSTALTLFENVFQLEPGHYLLVRADGSISAGVVALPRDPEPAYDFADGVEALQGALHNAVERQRIADVPLGVFLSGGVDSPLVAAEARQQTDGSLKAFTIGNPGWWQDEAEAASVYAQLLDVEHHLHNISGIDAAHVVDRRRCPDRAVWRLLHHPNTSARPHARNSRLLSAAMAAMNYSWDTSARRCYATGAIFNGRGW